MEASPDLQQTSPYLIQPRTVDVLLVTMPFAPLLQPSIGLSLLKAGLTRTNASCDVLYFTLRFAEEIGVREYGKISNAYQGSVLGEWIFAHTLFDESGMDIQGYIDDVLKGGLEAYNYREPVTDAFIEDVLRIRGKAESFLDSCLETISTYRFSIIGFTSIFHQHVASLALAKRVKARFPSRFIVFGGANCEGVMGAETIRQFDFIDAVVSGEGDFVFPELVKHVLAGRQERVADLEGVYTRKGKRIFGINGRYPNAPKVEALDTLPYPDYSDYFIQYEQSNFEKPSRGGRILFETSRGCWWGEKHHCTFCGLNGSSLTYRSKSPERAMAELEHILSNYPDWNISVVDNILDMRYFNSFIPALASKGLDIDLFYEVKANLQKRHVKLLRAAGITSIQPGIESLSTQVLRLMRKGVTFLQNIQLLKWCKEYGIRPYWNILWGFPGEPEEEYERVAQIVPLLTHLPPPESVGPVHLQRFSPNFDYSEAFGFTNVQPFPAYYYVYAPLTREAVANMAYYFTFSYQNERDVDAYTESFKHALDAWKNEHAKCDFFSVDKGDILILCDLRAQSEKPIIYLQGLAKEIYESCDGISSVAQLSKRLKCDPHDIEPILDNLVGMGLMLEEDEKYLSLAVPLGVYSPSRQVLQSFRDMLVNTAKKVDGRYILKADGLIKAPSSAISLAR